MKFDELYKKVIDSCRAFEERRVPISLDFKIEDLCDALVESNDTIEQFKAKLETVNELVKTSKDLYDRAVESLKASHYADSVDAGMRERRLNRSLWLARANSAEGQFFYWCARFGVESGFTKTDIRGYSVNTKRRLRTIGEWIEKWKNVKSKCRAKAEEYK